MSESFRLLCSESRALSVENLAQPLNSNTTQIKHTSTDVHLKIIRNKRSNNIKN